MNKDLGFIPETNEETSNQGPKASEEVPRTDSIYCKTRQFTGAESIFAWVCILIGYLFCRMYPPMDAPLGMLITVAIAIIGTTAVLNKKGATFNFYSIASVAVSLIFAISLLFTIRGLTSLIAMLCSMFAYFYFVYSATGNRSEKGMTNVVPLDIARAAFVFPFVSFGKLFPALSTKKSKSLKSVAKVFCGLAISLIPTIVIVAFLCYDEGFTELFVNILNFFDDFNVFSHLGSLILGVFVAMYIFGLYVTATNEDRLDTITGDDCENVFKHVRFVPTLTVAAAIAPILAVYVIFFISQWKYYVSAFTGVLPEGVLSYAEYARSGFFELCAVSVINFLIIIAIAVFQRREKQGEVMFLRLANVTISAMTLILIGTAMSKMWLYINRYGLTEKRVLSSWFMLVLALIYIAIILGQAIPKIKLVAASLVIVTVMTGILSFANYPSIIANYNVNLYISGKSEKIDVQTLYSLGDSAIPALVELAEYWERDDLDVLPFVDKNIQYERLVNALERSKNSINREKTFSSFSIPQYRAEKALNEFFKDK